MELEELIENTLRRKQLDEIGKDLKESNKKIDSLTNVLLKANSKAEKVVLEYKLRNKEYKALEKKYNVFMERLSLINAQVYASSKSLKCIDRKKVVKGKHDDKDDFDGTPTARTTEVLQSDSAASCDTQDTPLFKERPYKKGMTYNNLCRHSDYIQVRLYNAYKKKSPKLDFTIKRCTFVKSFNNKMLYKSEANLIINIL